MVYKSLNVSVFLGYTHTSSCLALPASERETLKKLLFFHPPPAHLRPPSGAQGALASKKNAKKTNFPMLFKRARGWHSYENEG